MNRVFALAGLAVAGLLTVGCSQWYYDLGEPLSERELPGADSAATLGEVLEILGPPHRASSSASGYVFAWEHWRVVENSLGFNLGALGIQFMSADWATVDTSGEFLLISFDQEHVLSGVSLSRWDGKVGDGKAFQPFGAVDLVTTRDLVSRYPHHRSGAMLLRRLPASLNAGSDMDSGAHGLERRGTPDSLGQRTLEFD